jgi:hypothetical protein
VQRQGLGVLEGKRWVAWRELLFRDLVHDALAGSAKLGIISPLVLNGPGLSKMSVSAYAISSMDKTNIAGK